MNVRMGAVCLKKGVVVCGVVDVRGWYVNNLVKKTERLIFVAIEPFRLNLAGAWIFQFPFFIHVVHLRA